MSNFTTTFIETLNYSTEVIVDSTVNTIQNDNLLFIITPLAMALRQTTIKPPINEEISPVTLNQTWSPLTRLIFLTILSVIGSVGNVFMISSVMIEDHLKKAGNAFVVNIALADLLVCLILMPSSTIVLLAMNGADESFESSLSVCKFQWFLAACAFLVSVITLAMTSIENYMRLCTSQDEPPFFGRTNVTATMLLIWVIGSVASGLQYIYKVSFDYCERKNANSTLKPFEMGVISVLIILPLIITFFIHIRIIIDARKFMSQPNFKANAAYKSDFSLVRSNFYSYMTFVLFWMPFSIAFSLSVSSSPENVNDRVFYYTAWIGLSKSVFHNIIYCITNRHFRNAYVNLFNYCCCKTTVSVSRRRNTEVTRNTTDVRVHIIPGYNMYSYTSPQRSGNMHHGHWSKRDCHEL